MPKWDGRVPALERTATEVLGRRTPGPCSRYQWRDFDFYDMAFKPLASTDRGQPFKVAPTSSGCAETLSHAPDKGAAH